MECRHIIRRRGLAVASEGLLTVPARGEARRWTAETLRWRLHRPAARYALHRGDDVLAVSCQERRSGVPIAVVLKVFGSQRLTASGGRALMRAVCRFHRTPVALHAGVNDLVAFPGITLPKRLRQSPLNLIYRSLDEESRAPAIARFEFLDFDAY